MGQVELNAVSKSYDGKLPIIKPLNIIVSQGEFLVLVGPSGCGKSTLLRMVAGLEKVSGGSILIDGHDVTHKEPRERGIAMVFQNYALYPHRTVAENMGYALKIKGMPKAEIKKRVHEVALSLELEDFLQRHPRELSGGQRQRVAMGRAIVRQPKVFLFDEPLSNLDARLRVQMRLELQQLHRRLKITSIYVTHDQVEAMTLAERVLVMNKGVVEQLGSPIEIYERPASTFVAGFMGAPAMNLLVGSVTADGTRLVFGAGYQLMLAAPGTLRPGQSVTLGIRAEHLVVIDNSTLGSMETSTNVWQIKVELLELLGADNLVQAKINGQSFVVRLPHEQRPLSGTMLNIILPDQALHFFDTDSGQRIE